MTHAITSFAKKALRYCPETGVFTWVVSPARAVKAGSTAGYLHPSGHRYISVKGVPVPAHRLAWRLFYGVWPKKHIDHIDGNPENNAISNLRELTHTQNLQAARKARCDNRSGLLGVSFRNDCSKWQARIQRNHRMLSLGVYDTPEEAHLVYLMYKNNF